jgi:hypothetical protein
MDHDPDREPLMQFFNHDDRLSFTDRLVMKAYADQAARVVGSTPRNPERTVCLRALLDAMNADLRAHHYKAPGS